jgi:hypothetical protein
MTANKRLETDLRTRSRGSRAFGYSIFELGCKVMVTEIPDDPHPRAVAMARWVLLAMGMLCFVLATQFCLAG